MPGTRPGGPADVRRRKKTRRDPATRFPSFGVASLLAFPAFAQDGSKWASVPGDGVPAVAPADRAGGGGGREMDAGPENATPPSGRPVGEVIARSQAAPIIPASSDTVKDVAGDAVKDTAEGAAKKAAEGAGGDAAGDVADDAVDD